MSEIKIGDEVTVKKTGERGTVEDIFTSRTGALPLYNILFHDGNDFFYLDEVEKYVPPKEYTVKVEVAENLVVEILYEVDENGTREVARSHAHIIHDGKLGLAQALAYAGRRMLESVDKDGVVYKRRTDG